MSKRFTYEVPREIGNMFEELDSRAYSIAAAGLYDGADKIADEIKENIPVDSGDLASSLFIARFERGLNRVDTVIGFAGYDSKGTPNPLKAAVLESGTSDGKHPATHFFSRATRNAKSRAEAAIEEKIEKKINEITGGT